MLVIDANIAVHYVLPGKSGTSVAQQLTTWLLNDETIMVPTLWVYETTSALSKSVHFGQLSAAEAEAALDVLAALPVEIVMPTAEMRRRALAWTFKLGRAAAYDSFYVVVAEQYQCTLWTRDKALVNAGNISWIQYLA